MASVPRRLVAAVLAIAGFVALAIWTQGAPPSVDRRWHADALANRSSTWDDAARSVTHLGSDYVVLVALAVVVLLAMRTARIGSRTATALLLTLFGGQLVRVVVNQLIGRPRPPRADWLVTARGDAFPSGHTFTATLGWGLVALVVLWMVEWRLARIGAFVVAALIGIAVGVSRVWLGVHWPTDVAGGLLLAAAWLLILSLLLDRTLPDNPSAVQQRAHH
jgi:membrane-associated phospholipid phosphatase